MTNARQPLQRAIRLMAITAVTAALNFVAVSTAQAASVTYQATDLTDTTPGQNLWQIDYTVSGPLDLFQGINLLFAPEQFADIMLLSNSSPDLLDVAPILQPDAGLAADGLLTITALGSLDTTFSGKLGVSLVWSGSGTPGAQPYEWLDDSFNVIASDVTTPVPEPEAIWLLLAGLLTAAATGAASRRRH